MEKYTIYCTEEQTKKALEMGAPIRVVDTLGDLVNTNFFTNTDTNLATIIPTAEQMIGWLEEQEGIKDIAIAQPCHWVFIIYEGISYHSTGEGFKTRKEATLAAIDAALEYLSRNKK